MDEDVEFYDPDYNPEVEEAEAQAAADETDVEVEDSTQDEETDSDSSDGDDGTESVDDPWSWVKEKGATPEAVRKTFEKFTPEWEAVKTKQSELDSKLAKLKPVEAFYNELESDPGLQSVIERYYAEGEGADKAAVKKQAELEKRLADIEIKARVENELATLRNKVIAAGDPDFDDAALIAFAGENMLPSLEYAYKLMHHDDLVKAAETRAFDEVKKNAKAKVTTVTKVAAPVKPTTLEDLENLSDEEFLARLKR